MKVKRIISITLILIMAMSTMTYAATLHAPDGRKINVYESEVGAYLNVGWYQAPVTVMYAEDDRTIVVYESEVKAYEKVGWTDGKSIITLYAPDGRTQNIPRSQRATYLKLGWYLYPCYDFAHVPYYPGTFIPDFGYAMFSTSYGSYLYGDLYVHSYYSSAPAAIICYYTLLSDLGWNFVDMDYSVANQIVLMYVKNNVELVVYHNTESSITQIIYEY